MGRLRGARRRRGEGGFKLYVRKGGRRGWEGAGGISVIQVVDTPIKQSKAPLADMTLEWVKAPSQGLSIVLIEESMPEEGEKSLEAFELEEEARTISPSVAPDRAPTFVKTLLDASPYYERLRKKRTALTTATPLTYEGHPFFEGL